MAQNVESVRVYIVSRLSISYDGYEASAVNRVEGVLSNFDEAERLKSLLNGVLDAKTPESQKYKVRSIMVFDTVSDLLNSVHTSHDSPE